MNIFVGNLSFDATEADVRGLFKDFGSVSSVAIVMDKNGRKSRGFAFVEMADDTQALAAIEALGGKEFMHRALNVSQAHSKQGPVKPGRGKSGYKQGRRSRSFVRRRAAAMTEERVEIKAERLSGDRGS